MPSPHAGARQLHTMRLAGLFLRARPAPTAKSSKARRRQMSPEEAEASQAASTGRTTNGRLRRLPATGAGGSGAERSPRARVRWREWTRSWRRRGGSCSDCWTPPPGGVCSAAWTHSPGCRPGRPADLRGAGGWRPDCQPRANGFPAGGLAPRGKRPRKKAKKDRQAEEGGEA